MTSQELRNFLNFKSDSNFIYIGCKEKHGASTMANHITRMVDGNLLVFSEKKDSIYFREDSNICSFNTGFKVDTFLNFINKIFINKTQNYKTTFIVFDNIFHVSKRYKDFFSNVEVKKILNQPLPIIYIFIESRDTKSDFFNNVDFNYLFLDNTYLNIINQEKKIVDEKKFNRDIENIGNFFVYNVNDKKYLYHYSNNSSYNNNDLIDKINTILTPQVCKKISNVIDIYLDKILHDLKK